MGKTIHSEARSMILKVNKFFEMEKSNRMYCIPVDQVIKRTCAATGVAKRTLMTIRRQAKEAAPSSEASTSTKLPTPGKKRKHYKRKIEVDDFVVCAMRNIINSFYTKNEVPTLHKILAVAKRDLNFLGGRTFLRSILIHKLGYKFKKCKGARTVLIQKPDIAESRARYLRLMIENMNLVVDRKPVTFMIHSHFTVQNNTDSSEKKKNDPGQRWIILHAGGENGFVPDAELLYRSKYTTGDYQNEIASTTFVKWLKEKIIPNLPPNGIVVLDNAPYHSKQSEKPPTSAARLCDMQHWLRENNIPFDENLSRRELYPILLRNKPPKKYIVDELLKKHGHEVVRMPPFHCDLNPVEYIWNIVKQRMAENCVNQSEKEIEKLTKDALSSITQSDWDREVNHVEILLQEYWDKDNVADENIRQLIISYGGEDSSDSEINESDSNGSNDSNNSNDESDEDVIMGIVPAVQYSSSDEGEADLIN